MWVYSDDGMLGFTPTTAQRRQLASLPIQFQVYKPSGAMNLKGVAIHQSHLPSVSSDTNSFDRWMTYTSARLKSLHAGIGVWSGKFLTRVPDSSILKDCLQFAATLEVPVFVWSKEDRRLVVFVLPAGHTEFLEQLIIDTEFVANQTLGARKKTLGTTPTFFPYLFNVMAEMKTGVIHLQAEESTVDAALESLLAYRKTSRESDIGRPQKLELETTSNEKIGSHENVGANGKLAVRFGAGILVAIVLVVLCIWLMQANGSSTPTSSFEKTLMSFHSKYVV